jgi:hypothetical protein
MNITESWQQVPDTFKVVGTGSPPVLHMFGVPVEQWSFIISIIIGLFYIIEKLPKVVASIKLMYRKFRERSSNAPLK